MYFNRAITVCYKEKYACFSGRASRAEFNYFLFFYFFMLFLLFFFGSIINASLGFTDSNFVTLALVAFFMIISFLPTLGVTVRRLHDLDRSAWHLILMFLLNLIPGVGLLILLILMCLKGTTGKNRYGVETI